MSTDLFGDKIESAGGELMITYDGAGAATGALPLEDLLASLKGWYDFFEFGARLYETRNFRESLSLPGRLISLRVRATRQGSFQVVVDFLRSPAGAIALGVAANRADRLIGWSLNQLWGWYKQLYSLHKQEKLYSADISRIARALQQMVQGTELDESERQNAYRAVELLDESLEQASRPLDGAANSIKVDPGNNLDGILIGRIDRAGTFPSFAFGDARKRLAESDYTLRPH